MGGDNVERPGRARAGRQARPVAPGQRESRGLRPVKAPSRAEDSSGPQWREGRPDWQPGHTCLLTGIVTASGF